MTRRARIRWLAAVAIALLLGVTAATAAVWRERAQALELDEAMRSSLCKQHVRN